MLFDSFDDFDSLFNKLHSAFTRPVKDMSPYRVYKKDSGFIVVCNTLGIDKKDLKVSVEKRKGSPYPVIKIVGQTKVEAINFENNVNLELSVSILEDQIEKVSYKTENGLTQVFVKMKKAEQTKIDVGYTDGDEFDF